MKRLPLRKLPAKSGSLQNFPVRFIPLAVLIAAAFVVVLIVYIIPQNHYNDAAACSKPASMICAITAFTALDGYSDSAARITECRE